MDVHFQIPPTLARRLDTVAEYRGDTRAELVRQLIRDALPTYEDQLWNTDPAYRAKRKEQWGLATEERPTE